MRWTLVIVGVAATLAVSPVALASPVRVDRSHGVRFDLAGSVLTVRLIPQENKAPPDARKQLWGRRIDAICSPSFSPRKARRLAVRAVRLWPRGQLELSYTFRRDVSDRVKWCLLEDGGRDVAGVTFEAFIRVYGESTNDTRIARKLRRYLQRNAEARLWLRQVSGIAVERGVIAVATELRRNRRGRQLARQLCGLIQGADVADFTPGHTIYGHEEVTLRVCAARRE